VKARVLLVLVAVLAGPGLARAGYVVRRGAEPMVVGTIKTTDVDDAGVYVHADSGAIHFVPWDRVRSVVIDGDLPRLDERLAVAEELWRARTRVERADMALAEPLLERLFERYRGRTHETAMLVAEGLLRCRIARGANAQAVLPALEVARLHHAGVSTTSYAMLPPVLDPDLLLCPELPPAWVQSRSLAKLERDLADYDAQGDGVVAALAEAYRRAAQQQLRGSVEAAAVRSDHGGVELLDLLVACGSEEAGPRRDARGRLEHEVDTLAPWAESWARFAIGASYLLETGQGRRERGLVSMLHVPARFARAQPYLAGLALAWVAAERDASGDDRTADIVRGDLARRFPNHPARSVDRPVRLPVVTGASPGASEKG
jgi:hypothetical protein